MNDFYRRNHNFNSYAGSKLVHRNEDTWGTIFVTDHGTDRILSFDGIYEQSRMDTEQPSRLVHEYLRAMLLGLVFVKPRHVTILGLGGGCLGRKVHAMFSDVDVDIVELRQTVADIAREYFGLPDSPRVRITVADAKHYLKQQPDESTDIIFADLYDSFGINYVQTQEHFLRLCHEVLTDQGWLILNLHQCPDIQSRFYKVLTALFPEIYVCFVSNEGNYILYAGKQKLAEPLNSYAEELKSWPIASTSLLIEMFVRIVRVEDL